MIALPDDLPNIALEDGRLVAFDPPWVASALRDAARRAGYPEWWLASHVVASVVSYLREHYRPTSVSVPRLKKTLESVLEVIGYSDVAREFDLGQPPVRISLEDLARAAGTGYELEFFRLLEGRLEEVFAGRVSRVELTDLAPCVKHLRSRKSWSSRCDDLREEIVLFVRQRMMGSRGKGKMAVSLS
jgi:hypothetical protein